MCPERTVVPIFDGDMKRGQRPITKQHVPEIYPGSFKKLMKKTVFASKIGLAGAHLSCSFLKFLSRSKPSHPIPTSAVGNPAFPQSHPTGDASGAAARSLPVLQHVLRDVYIDYNSMMIGVFLGLYENHTN